MPRNKAASAALFVYGPLADCETRRPDESRYGQVLPGAAIAFAGLMHAPMLAWYAAPDFVQG